MKPYIKMLGRLALIVGIFLAVATAYGQGTGPFKLIEIRELRPGGIQVIHAPDTTITVQATRTVQIPAGGSDYDLDSQMTLTVDKDEFSHNDQVVLTGDFTLNSLSPTHTNLPIGKYQVGGPPGSTPMHQSATNPSGGISGWQSAYRFWDSNAKINNGTTHTMELTHTVKQTLALQVGTAEYYLIRAIQTYGYGGTHNVDFVYFRGVVGALDPPVFPEPPVPECDNCEGGGMTTPPGAQSVCAPGPLLSHGFRGDLDLMNGMGGDCFGCGSGGAPGRVPLLTIGRFLYPNNQHVIGNSSPGHVFNFDHRLRLYDASPNSFTFFDANTGHTHWGDDSDTAGVFDFSQDGYYKSFSVVDGSNATVTDLTTLSDSNPLYATLVRRGGWEYKFQIVNVASGSNFDPMGRLLSIRTPDGYLTEFTYKTFTSSEITASPTRLLQIDTITDPGGNVAEVSYHTSQQAGRWVISEIDINSGDEVLEYSYNTDGHIESVSLNSEEKSTYDYGFDTTLNASTIVWYERLWKAQSRDVLFLSPNYSVWGGVLVNQFSDVLLARGEGATNPNSAPTPYLLVHRSTGTPGLYRINDRGKVFEWYRGRYKKYFDYIDTGASNPSLGFSGYVGTFEPTFTEHRNSSGGAPNEAEVFSGKHPKLIDDTGYLVEYTYDSNANVTRKDYVDTSYEKYEYNSKGQLTYHRDRGGFVKTYEYDTAGRIIRLAQGLSDPSGSGTPSSTATATQQIFGYYTSGAKEGFLQWTATTAYTTGSVTAPPADQRTDYDYTATGQISEVLGPVPAGQSARPVTEYTWTDGRLIKTTSPLNEETFYITDDLRRTIQVDYPDGSKEQTLYDDANRDVYKRDRVGVVSKTNWNIAGQQLTFISAYGRAANLTSTTLDSVNDVNTQSIVAYTYLPQQSQASYIDRNDARIIREFDFRGRQTTETHHPRSGMTRVTENFYVENQLFKIEESFDSFVRRRYFGRSADRMTIREIATREQTVTFADNAAILAATRVSGADPAHATTDAIRDERGQIVQMIDPSGTITESEFDAVGRNIKTIQGAGLAYELESTTEYNGKGQVIKTTDSAGTDTVMTYDDAGNVATRTIAHGTGSAATWSYTYTLDGRQETETMPNTGVNTTYYSTCCGQFVGSKNALGHGQISNVDPLGRTVHTAVVADYDTHTNPYDPIDGKTLSETTTRYRDDGRVAATTTWKEPLGTIDPLAPPIAGLNSVAANLGITTQYVYDNQLADGDGLDGSGGITINRLGGGTASVNIQAALAKLADTVANGGANVSFIATRSGKATVAISPDEKTMNVSIQDAMGRSVFQGLMSGPAATTPNQLLSWTSIALDETYSLSGVGLCEATWQIDQDGNYVQSVVNGLGQSVATLDQLAKLSRMKYNAAGNLLQQIDPLSNTTTFEYDGLGRQVKTIDPLTNETETVYHASTGRVTSQKDAKGESVLFTYNPLGQVLTTTDRTGKVTTNTYNSMGQVATVTDAESRATAYGYNLLGARNSLTFSDAGVQTVNAFDGAGRPLEITSPSGRKQEITYNFLGNVTQVKFRNSGGTETERQSMTYDAYGRETGMESQLYSASTAKTYNDRGQLATEATTYSGQTYTVSYTYDSQGRPIKLTYPSGREAEYTYDDRQLLKTIKWETTQIEDRSYNDTGILIGVDRAYVDETRTYNAGSQLTQIDNTSVGSQTYTYDLNGNVTSETLSGVMANYSFSTLHSGSPYADGYDAEDRFMRFKRSGVSEDILLTRSDIGNISNVNLNGGNTARGYNNIHGLTSIGAASQTYDTDGNTTTLHTAVTAAWDDAGRMKNTDVSSSATAGIEGLNEYGYVGGTRIWKKITRNGKGGPTVVEHRVYVHAGPNLIAEYNAGFAASTPVQEYVYAGEIDSLVMIRRSNGTKYGVARNRQWSITALHDLANGDVVERYAYEMTGKRTIYAANGTTVRTTSSYGNNFGYTNRWHDEESGLMHYRARYYNPLTGEFLSRDPMEFVDGMSLYRGYFVPTKVDMLGTKESDQSTISIDILLAIDGSLSDDWLKNAEKYGAARGFPRTLKYNRWLSHVKEFYRDYDAAPIRKRYMAGPNLAGSNSQAIIKEGHKWICEVYCREFGNFRNPCVSPPHIDLVGMSRGAIMVNEVAYLLHTEGCKCRYRDTKPIPVRYAGFYDPVNGEKEENWGPRLWATYRVGWDEVSANIGKSARVRAKRFPYMGGWGDLSRERWVRPNFSAAEAIGISATHSAFFGAPTFDGEGAALRGYTHELDIKGAIESDKFIRSRAILAGVPIGMVGDYDYRNLPGAGWIWE